MIKSEIFLIQCRLEESISYFCVQSSDFSKIHSRMVLQDINGDCEERLCTSRSSMQSGRGETTPLRLLIHSGLEKRTMLADWRMYD